MPPSKIGLREDYDAGGLRSLARRSRDSRQTRGLLALAAVYDGMSRAAAAAVGGMDRQTLRDWVHRFNAEGPEGLTDRPRSGMPRRLSDPQMRELAEIVDTGPDLAVDGVVRWRRVDLLRVIAEPSASFTACARSRTCSRRCHSPTSAAGRGIPAKSRACSRGSKNFPRTLDAHIG